MALEFDETIVAPATPLGVSAVAIVRLSGRDAFHIADGVIERSDDRRLESFPLRQLVNVQLADGGEIIDTALAVGFKAPNSFTGEDVVEFHVHGNPLIVDRLLEVLADAGARIALPGEFSRRALVNGKMDLTQVEALADVIAAESRVALENAQRQLGGEFGAMIESYRDELVGLLALLELELDFVEDGYQLASRERVAQVLNSLRGSVQKLVAAFKGGDRLRRGPRVVIVGLPNAGKSSLFNAFVGFGRSLVSDQAGTTRDYVEERVAHRGVVLHLLDTAGLRFANEAVEVAGVVRARALVGKADLAIFLVDASDVDVVPVALEELESLKSAHQSVRFFHVWSKVDLRDPGSGIRCSVNSRASVVDLLDLLSTEYVSNLCSGVLVSQRQHGVLSQMLGQLERIAVDGDSELVSFELREVLVLLDALLGRGSSEEVLDRVFSNFCIGK